MALWAKTSPGTNRLRSKLMSNFKLDKAEVGKMLRSQEMLSMIKEASSKQAKSDQHIKPFIGYDRAKAIIYPNTKEHPS